MAEIKLQKRAVYAGDVHIALLKAGWSIADATKFVREMPTAEVEPVRHGEWAKSEDDWNSLTIIIRGVKGEIYPCKPEIFRLTYEEVPQ